MTDIFLDGESLENEDWHTDDAASYVTIEISEGFHEVHSDTKLFAAYVTSIATTSGGGYGFAVHPTGKATCCSFKILYTFYIYFYSTSLCFETLFLLLVK